MQIINSSTNNKWVGINKPDEIVIHHFDDPAKHPQLSGVIAHFQDPMSQVSAHYIVSDKTIVKMMAETDAAWHAVTANTHSIGIEIDPNFPGDTYETVGALVADIRSRWGQIPLIRHRDVPGVSTTCPGDTDLNKIEQYAQGEDMTNSGDVVNMCRERGFEPAAAEINKWKNIAWKDFMYDLTKQYPWATIGKKPEPSDADKKLIALKSALDSLLN